MPNVWITIIYNWVSLKQYFHYSTQKSIEISISPRLCNSTRLSVKKVVNNIIEATILTGKFKGVDILLPRILMILTDMPIEFKWLQFPPQLAFSMTINKAQGQSLQLCGLNLANPCFSHGQLYVACSRFGKPSDLFVYAPDGKTKKFVDQKTELTAKHSFACLNYPVEFK